MEGYVEDSEGRELETLSDGVWKSRFGVVVYQSENPGAHRESSNLKQLSFKVECIG
jgi:hypothetical protein